MLWLKRRWSYITKGKNSGGHHFPAVIYFWQVEHWWPSSIRCCRWILIFSSWCWIDWTLDLDLRREKVSDLNIKLILRQKYFETNWQPTCEHLLPDESDSFGICGWSMILRYACDEGVPVCLSGFWAISRIEVYKLYQGD